MQHDAVRTWFAVVDVCVDEDDDDKGDEGGHPTDKEHDANAQQSAHKCQPLVVILERRSPPCKAIKLYEEGEEVVLKGRTEAEPVAFASDASKQE